MTRIDFYVLKDGSRGDRFGLCCRLVERIYKGALDGAKPPRVLIYCPEAKQARHLDRLLWSFREDSFLPHGLVGETDPALTPILISTNDQPKTEDQVLINLSPSPEAPPFFSRFERLCEPLDHEPEIRQAGRKRYLYYRDCGYPLEHHNVN
ncbi:DNA polymerase III subunit chi [Halochromatium roseum]|uniref:DNA polymerase III subunit chi n=1 Tax=Halochromatium roseum TaxID=391920 RepID=UPI0019128728|nr:DNA polymerase III subunit chi [Halochromatium roseum]MBK5939167.1 DNA polymerase III subunit chi [Halochromatium roseum]